jgi:hypothetical protein
LADDDTPPAGGKKTMGLDRRQWMILGAAAAGGVLWFWWRNRSANQTSANDTSGDTSSTDTSAYDQGLADAQNGAVTPYPVGGLTEAQLEALEASIAALHGPPSPAPGGTGGTGHPPIGHPPIPAGPGIPIKNQGWTKYTIQRGDTPAKIAKKTGKSFATIWAFNIGASSPHSASAKAELKREGQNSLKTGQWLAIPK